jgi:serine/threonine protein kinase
MNPRTMVRRYVAIKKENRPHGKNFHEYKILMEMRNGVSSLFPKYYIPLNMPGSDYNVNPIIIMDLLPDGNLVEFLRYKFHFLSLISKVYLMFSITMSLRYLMAYNIVHLDLKPNNIMLAPGLLIKLIDFGEAFHPEVCRSPNYRYRPGFTLPYSPPEFMLGLKHGFTSKSDVYSLGILMFEILYGKVPF